MLIDLVANLAVTLEGDHIFEACTWWNGDWRIRHASIFVADVFDEQQHQHIILVLAGVHAIPQIIARLPKRRVKFGLFECHVACDLSCRRVYAESG